jgi:hypothetical protein
MAVTAGAARGAAEMDAVRRPACVAMVMSLPAGLDPLQDIKAP